MPRQARLDLPGLVYHVMARGIERRDIFLDDRDRARFVESLSELGVDRFQGGRSAAISPKLWVRGFAGVLLILFQSFNPILFLILLPAGRNVYDLWKRKGETPDAYYRVEPKVKAQISLLYFGLLALLAVAIPLTHVRR